MVTIYVMTTINAGPKQSQKREWRYLPNRWKRWPILTIDGTHNDDNEKDVNAAWKQMDIMPWTSMHAIKNSEDDKELMERQNRKAKEDVRLFNLDSTSCVP